jgi:hypothetical protein
MPGYLEQMLEEHTLFRTARNKAINVEHAPDVNRKGQGQGRVNQYSSMAKQYWQFKYTRILQNINII